MIMNKKIIVLFCLKNYSATGTNTVAIDNKIEQAMVSTNIWISYN